MQIVLTSLLAILAQIAPGASTAVTSNVIQLLVALIPILIQEYKDLLPIVQNVITVLQQSSEITDDQWAALDAMSRQYDAEFMAAVTAAEAQEATPKS